MKITLVYRADAGDGVCPEAVCEEIARAGHEVVQVLETMPDADRAARGGAELIVVAGGDGTVGRAAIALAEAKGELPLGILPLGTANNIARSLGLDRTLRRSAEGWAALTPLGLDLGTARGPWGETRFVEAVGAGWIPAGIAAMDAHPDPGADPDESLARAIAEYRDVLAGLRPRRTTLLLDGERSEEELWLIEVLNIRSVGARIDLSAGADPADGHFDVVTAGEAQRAHVERYLERRAAGDEQARLDLPTRRARRVELHGWESVHVDDEIKATDGEVILLTVQPAAVPLLARHPDLVKAAG